MPTIRKQAVNLENLSYIGFQNTRFTDYNDAKSKTVGFFLNDPRLENVRNRPWKYIEKLRQYKQTLSLDLSCYTDMLLDDQLLNVFISRLIGAFWQLCGLVVIPTVVWSDEGSFRFCFLGLELHSIVAVSTIGTRRYKEQFMSGFIRMCKEIEPEAVICYCAPYQEMYSYATIVSVDYEGKLAKTLAAKRPSAGQLTLFQNHDKEM